jgi:hypothetical protein
MKLIGVNIGNLSRFFCFVTKVHHFVAAAMRIERAIVVRGFAEWDKIGGINVLKCELLNHYWRVFETWLHGCDGAVLMPARISTSVHYMDKVWMAREFLGHAEVRRLGSGLA